MDDATLQGSTTDEGAGQGRAERPRLRRRLLLGLPLLAGAVLGTRARPAQAGSATDPWTMEGNANIDANDFIGSTGAQPLRIRTNNILRAIVTAAGNVGISIAAPTARLHVVSGTGTTTRSENSAAAGIGVYGLNTAAAAAAGAAGVRGESAGPAGNAVYGLLTAAAPAATAAAVRGEVTAAGTNGLGVFGSHAGDGHGVLGQSFTGDGVRGTTNGGAGDGGTHGLNTGTNGYGAWGEANSGTGARGVYGSSTTGVGVYGSGATHGVFGTTGTSGTAGVYGTTTTSNGIAVFGETNTSLAAAVQGTCGGENGEGVSGIITATTGTTNFGVFGSCSAARGDAGRFSGDVTVSGTLSKGAGAFKIDHPLDPKNKYLMHSFVESPDMKNVYDGVATLDASGAAEVTLPGYFEALNREFRYQLTAMGQAAPGLHIKQEVAGNRFSIAGGKGGMKVSWQITGTRKDSYAEANRIPNELDKAAHERGRLLHPEAFGLSEREGVDFERVERLRLRAARAKADVSSASADVQD